MITLVSRYRPAREPDMMAYATDNEAADEIEPRVRKHLKEHTAPLQDISDTALNRGFVHKSNVGKFAAFLQ
jgi:hypothetical protein